MYDVFAPLIVGLLGSVHCLGRCGPLVVAYALHGRPLETENRAYWKTAWNSGFFHHTAFHLGRIFTYGVLGGIAAGLFRAADVSFLFSQNQGAMRVFGGILLILIGLVLLKIVPLPSWLSSVSLSSGTFIGRWLPPLFNSPRTTSKVVLGLATGLLPCGLSWAMVVTAAATQDPIKGWLTMLMFGLGTIPLLLLTGLSVRLLSLRARFLGERAAALSIVVMGVMLAYKGINQSACCF